ncbi:MAG TPA: ankyrin repeat domain-containing protein [Vicinamibacteria bacterium]|nr:ankyrin repeat domain-containing protein [Vicinamibacteria bacterium]
MTDHEEMLNEAFLQYRRVVEVLESGAVDQLEALAHELPGFPDGEDPFLGRRWITNALGEGSKRAVEWMLQKGVDLTFCDPEGYTPIHTTLDRARDDRYELLDALLKAGAPVNVKGANDWTPAHMAAARDDVDALRILVRHGADLTIRTDIDDYATPLEEARNLGRTKAVHFLESVL